LRLLPFDIGARDQGQRRQGFIRRARRARSGNDNGFKGDGLLRRTKGWGAEQQQGRRQKALFHLVFLRAHPREQGSGNIVRRKERQAPW
jgi:hypothetical protein